MHVHARALANLKPCFSACAASPQAQLDALVLNGSLDVGRLKRDLASVRAMFEELGQLALSGDVVTLRQVRRVCK
eukprot:363895-Chlamydomonas_euryale.AAC.5